MPTYNPIYEINDPRIAIILKEALKEEIKKVEKKLKDVKYKDDKQRWERLSDAKFSYECAIYQIEMELGGNATKTKIKY